MLADYEKGAITPEVSRAVIRRCRERGIPCVVDPKKADFSAYSRATVVTPNLMEAERAAGGRCTGMRRSPAPPTSCRKATSGSDAMLITRGPEGMTLSTAGRRSLHIPARSATWPT